jgi:hypothetical protein
VLTLTSAIEFNPSLKLVERPVRVIGQRPTFGVLSVIGSDSRDVCRVGQLYEKMILVIAGCATSLLAEIFGRPSRRRTGRKSPLAR